MRNRYWRMRSAGSRLNSLGWFVVACSLAATVAFAETNYAVAPVVASHAIYEVVEVSVPSQQCWEEEIAAQEGYNSRTPLLISTIIGGAIGNAVGHSKSNKRVGAVVGAVLGHSIGRDIMQNQARGRAGTVEIVQRCETVYQRLEEERLMGYQVTYLYNGEEFSIRTESDPGPEIQLRVDVQPML